ncbi:B3 domain-containing protein [Hordeum vulgare]|nr:B3 domain-containing protein [Hordeum vulgare]
MEFFTIILEKSSSRHVMSDNFVKMLDGYRPQNMKMRQASNGLRKLWDVEVVFDTDGSMYLDRGWKHFVRAYDLRHSLQVRRQRHVCREEMVFFTIILEKSSSRQVLPDNFVKMLDDHRPQNMKLRQASNGLRKLWDVKVVFDTDGSMYLDRGRKQFVRAYDLWHGYFLVFRYDDNVTFAAKVFDTTMCQRRYQDDDSLGFLKYGIVCEQRVLLKDESSAKLDKRYQLQGKNCVKLKHGSIPPTKKLLTSTSSAS